MAPARTGNLFVTAIDAVDTPPVSPTLYLRLGGPGDFPDVLGYASTANPGGVWSGGACSPPMPTQTVSPDGTPGFGQRSAFSLLPTPNPAPVVVTRAVAAGVPTTTGGVLIRSTTTTSPGTYDVLMKKFVTPPLAPQSVPAGAWTERLALRRNGAPPEPAYASVAGTMKLWRPGVGYVHTVWDEVGTPRTCPADFAAAPHLSFTVGGFDLWVASRSASGFTAQAGDRLVYEPWLHFMAPDGTTQAITQIWLYYDGNVPLQPGVDWGLTQSPASHVEGPQGLRYLADTGAFGPWAYRGGHSDASAPTPELVTNATWFAFGELGTPQPGVWPEVSPPPTVVRTFGGVPFDGGGLTMRVSWNHGGAVGGLWWRGTLGGQQAHPGGQPVAGGPPVPVPSPYPDDSVRAFAVTPGETYFVSAVQRRHGPETGDGGLVSVVLDFLGAASGGISGAGDTLFFDDFFFTNPSNARTSWVLDGGWRYRWMTVTVPVVAPAFGGPITSAMLYLFTQDPTGDATIGRIMVRKVVPKTGQSGERGEFVMYHPPYQPLGGVPYLARAGRLPTLLPSETLLPSDTLFSPD